MDELTQAEAATTAQAIPVANLWWLLLYASDWLRGGRQKVWNNTLRHVALSQESLHQLESAAIPGLLTQQFLSALQTHVHRGVLQESRATQATVNRVRGRIELLPTLTRQLPAQGKIACRFPAWQTHRTFYQVLLAALVYVMPLLKDTSLVKQCHQSKRLLQGLGLNNAIAPLSVQQARELRVDLPPLPDSTPRFLLAAARLILSLALPSEQAGTLYLLQPSRDLVWLRRLYEKAIGGFYQLHAPAYGWQVKTGLPLHWQTREPTPDIAALLPGMRTDIVLEHPGAGTKPGRRIIIETKFTDILHSTPFRPESIKSTHLYQLYAYVMSQHNPADPLSLTSQGILLHPAFNREIAAHVTIQGHPLHFKTLNLTAPAQVWQTTLLGVLSFSA